MKGTLLACEIKLTTSPDPRDIAQLRSLGREIGAKKFALISRSHNITKTADTILTDIKGFLAELNSLL